MNSLNSAIINAYAAEGSLQAANKVYLEFIKANFIIPIEKEGPEEDPRVLFYEEKDCLFLPVFNELHYLDAWITDISDKIKLLKLSGVDLLKGIGENVTVCLNLGSEIYKEFNPDELARMRSMVLKFFKN